MAHAKSSDPATPPKFETCTRDEYFYDEANQRYFDKDYDIVYDDQELHVSDYNHEKTNEHDTFYTYNRFSHRGRGRGIQPRPYMSRGPQKLSYPSIRRGLQTQGQTYSRGTFKNISGSAEGGGIHMTKMEIP